MRPNLVIRASEFFWVLKTHHGFAPDKREADLQGRLSVLAEREATDPLTRQLLRLFIAKHTAGSEEKSQYPLVS